MKKLIVLGVISSCLACSNQSPLKQALLLSGENREELLRVLEHYAAEPEKLQAAVFLIENMPGHYSFASEELNHYRSAVQTDPRIGTLPWSLKNIFTGYPYRLEDIALEADTLHDIRHIRADFLIDNIDRAFLAWKLPWARHLTFEEFCEYLLPYRVEHEPLDHWRDSLESEYADRIEWITKIDEYYGSAFWACSYLNDEMIRVYREAYVASASFSHPLLWEEVDARKWTCSDYVYGTLFAMRSAGIPVGMDFIPQWASRRNPHFWNVVLNNNKQNIPFVGFDKGPIERHKPDVKMVKVYRRTFARNESPLVRVSFGEAVPPFFTNPFYRDVTQEYLGTCDIRVNLSVRPGEKRKLAYLCVFDNEKWVPVDWGRIRRNKVSFGDVGTQVVCLVGYWIEDEIVPASPPFRIRNDGTLQYLVPDRKHTIPLALTRKYPLSHQIVDYGDSFLGVVVEASNEPDFATVDTLHTIDRNYWGNYATFIPGSPGEYRYVRIRRSGRRALPVAEFQVYADGAGQPHDGPVIASRREKIEEILSRNLSDGDPLTRMHITEWAGLDLRDSLRIDSLRLLTYHDDNNVVPGELYELFYWDGPEPISLGRVTATGYTLRYDSVPGGTLYLLRNRTKGREERIFTYENDRVVFW